MSGKMEPAAEFAALFPTAGRVALGDAHADIRVLDCRHLAKIAQVLKPVVKANPQLETDLRSRDVAIITLSIGELLADHADDLFGAIAIALDWDVDRVGALPPDKLLEIAVALVEKNRDFFIQHVAPLAYGVQANASGVSDGLTSSPI